MLDPKHLRHNVATAAKQLAQRGYSLDIHRLETLESQRKNLQITLQTLQHQANQLAKQLGSRMSLKAPLQEENTLEEGNEKLKLLRESRTVKVKLDQVSSELQKIQQQREDFLLSIPNLPHNSVPFGRSRADNQVVRCWGEPRVLTFTPKNHLELSGKKMDFEGAARITGSRFVILKGVLARLQRALIQLMLDIHTQEHGYEELYVPYLVNRDSLQGTGQLPLFFDDLFSLKGSQGFYLIPTAEVPVTNLARACIFDANALPQKYVCHTPCFRSEAGSYGKDVRGLIRQHQFDKVELVQFVVPEAAQQALENLTSEAEAVLQRLALPYRVVSLCTGDLGFASTKTYDLEVWLPGQSQFREISSCSHMGDFQARRLKARWRRSTSYPPELIHTLNGSGLAVGRTLVALLENCQDADGNVWLPEALQPYMSGLRVLENKDLQI